MTDPAVIKMCKDTNISTEPESFDNNTTYYVVVEYLLKYSASTAENYIWRLCRHLRPHNLAIYERYEWLLQMYKKKYNKNK